MAKQLNFTLPFKSALGRENFFVSSANQLAVNLLETWGDWPQSKMVLVGPKGSGKTHLAHVWASEVQARLVEARALDRLDLPEAANCPWIVEDIDRIAGDRPAETILFHFHNLMQAEGKGLLMTSATAPIHLDLALPDLKSRLSASLVASIKAPDDPLLSAILLKQFSERQINIPAKLLDYIVSRLPGSFAAAKEMVELLDERAMTEKRPIGQGLAREVLDSLLDKNPENPA